MNGTEAESLLLENGPFWAHVEVVGRRSLWGKVTVQTIGGAALFRVESPALPERTRKEWGHYSIEQDARASYGFYEITFPPEPSTFSLVGIGSIYMITPVTEAVAMLKHSGTINTNPIRVVKLDEPKQLEAVVIEDNDGDDEQEFPY